MSEQRTYHTSQRTRQRERVVDICSTDELEVRQRLTSEDKRYIKKMEEVYFFCGVRVSNHLLPNKIMHLEKG